MIDQSYIMAGSEIPETNLPQDDDIFSKRFMINDPSGVSNIH